MIDEINKSKYRGWVYKSLGNYHKNLDPNWTYTPTYLRKMKLVRNYLWTMGSDTHILDAGCGEGVLVEEFRQHGFLIEGLDLNYESDHVRLGSILEIPYEDGSFDAVLLLDVLEHLVYPDQLTALEEIRRVLRDGGMLIASVPNLAHWNSRFRLTLFGELDRTDTELNHVGERPFSENLRLLEQKKFSIQNIHGVTLTVPFIYRRIICRWPAKFRWLHDLLEPLAIPPLAMINIFVCKRY